MSDCVVCVKSNTLYVVCGEKWRKAREGGREGGKERGRKGGREGGRNGGKSNETKRIQR